MTFFTWLRHQLPRVAFPAGVPRMGPPTKIMATPTEIVFLYNQKNTWRLMC
jgi:hypothetical protein